MGDDFKIDGQPNSNDLPDLMFFDTIDMIPDFYAHPGEDIDKLKTEVLHLRIRIEQLEQAVQRLSRQRAAGGVPIVGETPKEEADRIVADWIRRNQK